MSFDKKEMPTAKTPVAAKDKATEELVKKMKEQDGFQGTSEEYIERQEKALRELKAQDGVNKVAQGQDELSNEVPEDDPASGDQPEETEVMARSQQRARSLESLKDLGDYTPTDFEITRWDRLFPELKLKLPPTMSQIYLAKLWVFLMTRLEFSQYIQFLADVGGWACENRFIAADADAYREICDDFLRELLSDLEMTGNQPFSKADYKGKYDEFELRVQSSSAFGSQKIYEMFFENYDLFGPNQLGFIQILRDPSEHDRSLYNTSDRGFEEIGAVVSRNGMSEFAQRLYPVLTARGDINLVWFLGDFAFFQEEVSYKKIEDVAGYGTIWQWTRASDEPAIETLGVGFADLSDGTHIFGAPMFEEQPFSEVLEGLDLPEHAARG